MLVGEDAALRIDGRGTHHGLAARLYRLVQFTQMDQAPDFRRYELEARRGHPVIAIRETDPARRKAIRAILRARGAHFTNFYGRFFTETLDPFDGPRRGRPADLGVALAAPPCRRRGQRPERNVGNRTSGRPASASRSRWAFWLNRIRSHQCRDHPLGQEDHRHASAPAPRSPRDTGSAARQGCGTAISR